MKNIVKTLSLDKGFYKSARTLEVPRTSYGFIFDLMKSKGFEPSADEINRRVDKVLRKLKVFGSQKRHISDGVMRKLEEHVVDTWGLEQALADEGIRVKGFGADKVSKFYTTTTSTVLFPAYIESQVMMGILANAILSSIIAGTTPVNQKLVQGMKLTDVEADQQLAHVGEGVKLPETKITTSDANLELKKFGRLLSATYEALAGQSIDLFGLFLERIGMRIALDKTNEAIEVLIAGDGNANSAVVDTDAETTGTIDYRQLTRLYLAFPDGYQMTTAITNAPVMLSIMNLAEFKDPMAGFTFSRDGVLPGVFGADWHVWRSTNSTSFSTDRVLAVDNSIALQEYSWGGVQTESDRLIDQQVERSTISEWAGFLKLDGSATQCLDITT